MRVLLIEDSIRLQQTIGAALRRSGYALDVSGDGEDGLWLAENNDYDAIVLDIMLPKLDGLALLHRLRARGKDTHVLLLTARDTMPDRVRGLRTGADEYLVKPFALEELLARVEAFCRRQDGDKQTRLALANLDIDTAAKKVWRAGEVVKLKPREYQLLEYLAHRRGEGRHPNRNRGASLQRRRRTDEQCRRVDSIVVAPEAPRAEFGPDHSHATRTGLRAGGRRTMTTIRERLMRRLLAGWAVLRVAGGEKRAPSPLPSPPMGARVAVMPRRFQRSFREQTNETLNSMKTHLRHLVGWIAIITAEVLAAGCATEESQAELQAKAKITEAQAQQTALAKAPGGTVKTCELEEEKGRLVWSFDIATPGTKDITEVLVDAITGDVVSTERETPAQQEKEEQGKSNEKADKSWKETLTAPDEPLAASGRNRYFILDPGYQLVLEGKEDGKVVNLTITVLDETKQVASVQTRVVEERESAGGKLVEVSRNYFAIGTQTRNVYYFGEDVDIHKGDKIVHEGAWLAGVNDAKHGIAMPGEIQIGAKYYQEKAPKVAMDRAENVSFSESIETPAGTFKNCLKVKETTPLESGTEHKIYAPEVGLVQDGSLRLVQYGFVKK